MSHQRLVSCSILVLFIVIAPPGYSAEIASPKGRPYHVPARVNVLYPSPHRQTIQLDGEWSFEIDPKDIGTEKRWFDPAARPKLARSIAVPGCWDIQGVGNPVRNAFHNYVGPAWYRRTAPVPADWRARRCWVKIGGAHRYADVWVNAKYVGRHDTYVTAFKFDVTDLIEPGKPVVIAIRVDNRPAYPNDMTGCFSWFVNWGGIFRSVELEATSMSYLADVFIQPDVKNGAVKLLVDAVGANVASVAVKINDRTASAPIAAARREYGRARQNSGPYGDGVQRPKSGGFGYAAVVVPMPNAKLWSPKSPELYLAEIELRQADGAVIDSWRERFGMRSLGVRDGDILLNGRPIFLRGYGNDCIQPLTLHTPIDRDYHLDHFRKTKSYGFLYVRHHSWTPPPEYFDAADELGFLLQPELPVGYQPWLLPNAEKLERQLREVVLQYKNHPSMAIYSMGNEFQVSGKVKKLLDRFVELVQQMDPTRLIRYTDPGPIWATNGIGGECHGVLHEYANVCAYPDVRIKAKYKDGYRPVRIEWAEAAARRNGLESLLPTFAANSIRLQSILTQIYVENARARAPEVDGYNYWLITDCADEASTGVFDDFWADKGYWTPELFREMNDETVLMVRATRPLWHGSSNWGGGETIDTRRLMGRAWPSTFRSGDAMELDVLISDYSGIPVRDGKLEWRIESADGNALTSGTLNGLSVEIGNGASQLCTLKAEAPNVDAPLQGALRLRLRDEKHDVAKHYRVWIFPAGGLMEQAPRQISISGEGRLVDALVNRYPFIKLDANDARVRIVVGDPTVEDLDFMASSGTTLVLGKHCFRSEQAAFGTSWWQGGNNRGTVIRSHPSIEGLPHEGFADLQLQRLIDGGRVMILSGAPIPIDPIIRGIDNPGHARPQAYLFEAPVGDSGWMVVTTLNFEDKFDTPEGAWLLDRLIRYIVKPHRAVPDAGRKMLDWLRPSPDSITVTQSFDYTPRQSGRPQAAPPLLAPGQSATAAIDLIYDGVLPVSVEMEQRIPSALRPQGELRREVDLAPGIPKRIVWPIVAAEIGQWTIGPATISTLDQILTVDAAGVRVALPTDVFNPSFELAAGIAPSETTRVVARYEFREGDGRTLHDSVGTNHGKIYGGAQWVDGPTVDSHALEFDGRSGYVTVPDASAIDLESGFAVEATFRLGAGHTGDACLVDKGGSARRNYCIYAGRGELGVATFHDGSEFLKYTRSLDLARGVWHTAVWACNSAAAWLHVDGRLRERWPVDANRLESNDTPLYMGKREPQNDMFLNGALAKVVIAEMSGQPTLTPVGWTLLTEGGTACIDETTKAAGSASLRVAPKGQHCTVRANGSIRVTPGAAYTIGAAMAVSADYDRRAGMPVIVYRAGGREWRVALGADAEAGGFVERTAVLTVPEGATEMTIDLEASGEAGAAWFDGVVLSHEARWQAIIAAGEVPREPFLGVQWREAEEPDATNGDPPPKTSRVADPDASNGSAVRLTPPDSLWAGLWWSFKTKPKTLYAVWVRYRTDSQSAGYDDLFVCDATGKELTKGGHHHIPLSPEESGYRWFRRLFYSGDLSEVHVYLENQWNNIATGPSALWDAVVIEEIE